MDIPDNFPEGYIKGEKISITYKEEQKAEQTLVLRRVVYYDVQKKRLLQLLTKPL